MSDLRASDKPYQSSRRTPRVHPSWMSHWIVSNGSADRRKTTPTPMRRDSVYALARFLSRAAAQTVGHGLDTT